jgi:hypothetical protein
MPGPGADEVGAVPEEGKALGVEVDDLNALLCFKVGKRVKRFSTAGPGGLDLPEHTSVFVTAQDNLGSGVYVRRAFADPLTDTVIIKLNQPAKKRGCVAWHTREQSIY